MRLPLERAHELQLILLEVSELVPVLHDRREHLIGRHVHRALYQAVVARQCRHFLLLFLRRLTSIFFLLQSGGLGGCQLFCRFSGLEHLGGGLWLTDLPVEF
jgi:hypothetical protein